METYKKFEKLFVYSMLLFMALLVPAFSIRIRSVILNETIVNGVILVFALFTAVSITLVFLTSPRETNDKRFRYLKLLPVVSIYFAVGGVFGYVFSNPIVGFGALVYPSKPFRAYYSCVKSDNVRRLGIVNRMTDENQVTRRIEGYEALCGYAGFRENSMYTISGRQSVFGRVITEIRLSDDAR